MNLYKNILYKIKQYCTLPYNKNVFIMDVLLGSCIGAILQITYIIYKYI